MLGEYFTEMLDVLLPQQGTLDKLIGDSIMMYFGCPIARSGARGARVPRRAGHAAADDGAQRAMERAGLPRCERASASTPGVAVAGNMGTTTIFNYTILGDCVNLASRLEGVNKEYGTLIIVGRGYVEAACATRSRGESWTGFASREEPQPVAIYELSGEPGEIDASRRELFERYAEGLQFYRAQQWTDAAQAFRRALEAEPDDGPSHALLKRCAAFEQRSPASWDGVYIMGAS